MSKQRYRRLSAEQWRRLVDEQQQSGLSQRAFCETHGLTVSTFNNWKRRLTMTPPEGGSEVDVVFTPLPEVALCGSVDETDRGWDVELDLGGGVCLRLRRR